MRLLAVGGLFHDVSSCAASDAGAEDAKLLNHVAKLCDFLFYLLLACEIIVIGVFVFLMVTCRPVAYDGVTAPPGVNQSVDESTQGSGSDHDELPELNQFTRPCVVVSKDRAPCDPRREFGLDHIVPSSRILPESPPSLEDILFNAYGTLSPTELPTELMVGATHIVARGVFVTDSTNCDTFPRLFPEWMFGDAGSLYPELPEGTTVEGDWNVHQWSCFTQFEVGEYMVGDGPGSIAVMHPRFAVTYDTADTPSLEPFGDELSVYQDQIADAYEGYEWVLWLAPAPNTSVQSWAAFRYWDVQKDADGTVRVVSPDYLHYQAAGLTGTALERLNVPVDRFRRDIVAAHESRLSMTSGRIGVATTTPDLVTSVEMLPDHFDEIGASDNPVATPAPPPARPLAPRELTTGSPSEVGIPLSWSAPLISRVSGYKIVRRVPKGEFDTVAADTSTTATTYTDTSAPMTAGVTYIYRVIALNEYGESVASNRATVELPGPDAPADFTATYSDGDVVLTWTQPGVIQPSCYRIYRRAQGERNFQWVVYCWRPDLRSWTDDDVQSGTRYIYRIVPMIGTTESGATARASVRVP